MARLIRSGHTRVFEYGYRFLMECQEELEASKKFSQVEMASSVRLARAEDKEWKKYVDSVYRVPKKAVKKEKKKVMTADEHRAVIAKLRGL